MPTQTKIPQLGAKNRHHVVSLLGKYELTKLKTTKLDTDAYYKDIPIAHLPLFQRYHCDYS